MPMFFNVRLNFVGGLLTVAFLAGCSDEERSGLGPAFIVEEETAYSLTDPSGFAYGWYEFASALEGQGYVQARTYPDPPTAGGLNQVEMRIGIHDQRPISQHRVFVRIRRANSDFEVAPEEPIPAWIELKPVGSGPIQDIASESRSWMSGTVVQYELMRSGRENRYVADVSFKPGPQTLEFMIVPASAGPRSKRTVTFQGWSFFAHPASDS